MRCLGDWIQLLDKLRFAAHAPRTRLLQRSCCVLLRMCLAHVFCRGHAPSMLSLKHPMRARVESSTRFLVSTSKALGCQALRIWDSQIRNLELFAPVSQYCREDYRTYRNKWHGSQSCDKHLVKTSVEAQLW